MTAKKTQVKRPQRLTPAEQVIQAAKALSANDLEKVFSALTEILGGVKPPRPITVKNREGHTQTFQCTDFSIDGDGRLLLHEHGSLAALFNTGEWRFLGVDRS